MNKSYVSIEQNVCPVCGKTFETGTLLMDNKLRDKFEMHTVTGYSLCPEHQAQFEDGYLHLVVAENPHKGSRMKIEDAVYQGEVLSIKRHVAAQIFNTEFPDDLPMVYIEPEVARLLKESFQPAGQLEAAVA